MYLPCILCASSVVYTLNRNYVWYGSFSINLKIVFQSKVKGLKCFNQKQNLQYNFPFYNSMAKWPSPYVVSVENHCHSMFCRMQFCLTNFSKLKIFIFE